MDLTLSKIVADATNELREAITDAPNQGDYSDNISDIADDKMTMDTATALELALRDLWLAASEPDSDAGYTTAVQMIQQNVYEHVYNELSKIVDDLRAELTGNCDQCGDTYLDSDLQDVQDGDYDQLLCPTCYAAYVPETDAELAAQTERALRIAN